MRNYAPGVRCYVPGCGRLCQMGKLCTEHWHKLPLHMRPAAWNGEIAEALKWFDKDGRVKAGRRDKGGSIARL